MLDSEYQMYRQDAETRLLVKPRVIEAQVKVLLQ